MGEGAAPRALGKAGAVRCLGITGAGDGGGHRLAGRLHRVIPPAHLCAVQAADTGGAQAAPHHSGVPGMPELKVFFFASPIPGKG